MERYLDAKAKFIVDTLYAMCCKAKIGHISSACSCVDILVALYYGETLRFNPAESEDPNRDRFILSKGHAGVALYPILADLGFIDFEELEKFCTANGILGGHPSAHIPGVEVGTGSLGYGLGIGSGMAMAAKLRREHWMTFVLMSDGECYEGSVWEAAMFASHNRLSNLVGIIDRNFQGATDFTENAIALEPLADKWLAFGWDVQIVNGHNVIALIEVLNATRNRYSNRPKMIIAHTIKGFRVDFMCYDPAWHARCPDPSTIGDYMNVDDKSTQS